MHLSEKQVLRWFSGSKRQLYATHHWGKELKEHLQRRIDTLQEQIEELEVRYPSPRKAEIEWEEESLISSFVLKSKPFDIKDLIPLQPKLQRKDATLSNRRVKSQQMVENKQVITSLRCNHPDEPSKDS